jgi:ornithine cyclodeaminase
MPDPTLWLSEADVVSVIDLPGAIAALAEGFAAEAAGMAVPLDKTMATFAARGGGHGTLHALGGAVGDLAGAKVWAHTPGGADPLLVLVDSGTGAVAAVIEAFALGQLRTAATAGLATDRLAAPGASVLAVIGTGKQALPQVAAVAAVRPITQVRVYSRSSANRDTFAARVRDELGLECSAVSSADTAVDGSDVVTLITRATSPVLTAAMVHPGLHVNAVGAIDLTRREFEPSILSGATVVSDSPSQARQLSAELRDFYGDSDSGWQTLRPLGAVVLAGTGRTDLTDVTLFKGMGSGIADLAVGAAVLDRVRGAGGGTTITRTGRAQPVLISKE